MKTLLAIALLALVPTQAWAAAAMITVTGHFVRSDNITPAVGQVMFELKQALNDTSNGTTFATTPRVATIDGSGNISISLVSTNDPVINPAGGTYKITKVLDGISNTFEAVLPYNALGGTTTVAALVPSSASIVYSASPSQINAAVNQSNLVTITGAQTITGQKTFFGAGNTGVIYDATAASGSVWKLKMNAPPNGNWIYDARLTSAGAFETGAWITVSGSRGSSPDSEGWTSILRPTSDPYMIGVASDVFGPAMVSRALGVNQGGSSYAAMDDAGHYVWAVIDQAEMQFGDSAQGTPPSSTHPLDVRLYRNGISSLRTNSDFRSDGILHAANRIESESAIVGFTLNDGNLNARISWVDSTKGTTYKSYWEELGSPATGHVFDTSTPYTLNSKIVDFQSGSVSQAAILAHGEVKAGGFVSTAPVLTACTTTQRGAMAYVDDSDDAAVSHMCFCGTGADDATYSWRRMDAPGTACP